MEQGHPMLARPEVERAWAFIQELDEWVLARQMELTAIPAPPFGEAERGARMAQLFREAGLGKVETDEVGNVLAWWGATRPGRPTIPDPMPALVVSAHLDTVFPAGTKVEPRVVGDRIYAPGISDDGRGLAALLALARILEEVPFSLPFPLLFVATVGEEGPGNLRGVRHLYSQLEERSMGFVSLDGTGMDRIICRGIGSVRFRITLRGEGGHSWADFGRPNPIHTLGRIVARLEELDLSVDPKTTLTVARWGGGTSINSIPEEAWVEMDLRSQAEDQLDELERRSESVIEEVVDELERRSAAIIEEEMEVRNPGTGSSPSLSVIREDIGRRPAGRTPADDPLVQSALEATRLMGEEGLLASSSTDANVPMALGIPAITMGAGGTSGGTHTVDEWYGNRKGPEGIFRALLTLLLLSDRM